MTTALEDGADPYHRNVFVNCPFDPAYRKLLHPLLFTTADLGFTPQIASERQDSGEQRIDKIASLIETSRFGIHDLCRCQANVPDELFRLNMPFELGMDVACRRYGGDRHSGKRLLILETKPFRYQAALSDIAGCDIASHDDKPSNIVAVVRKWLSQHLATDPIGPAGIWARFTDYNSWMFEHLDRRHFSKRDVKNLGMAERLKLMRQWIADNPSP